MLDEFELGGLYVFLQELSHVHVFGKVVMLRDVFQSDKDVYANIRSYDILMFCILMHMTYMNAIGCVEASSYH